MKNPDFYKSSQDHPAYRPDIDGLRAVAVLAVVAFHAFPSALIGGFIGVDVFFVISGYLISSIIFSALKHNRFSLSDFYARRVRRLFPALILVLLFVFILGWFTLYADEYYTLGRHLRSAALFMLNITLWRDSGYFDAILSAKPLLHLWSLAVEEQFYIFWPLLLMLAWRRRWNLLTVAGIIATGSFAVNIFMAKHHPAADFYLPFTRFWELMAGCLLAWRTLQNKSISFTKAQRHAASLGGGLLLALGFALIDPERVFPGWWALMPVLGAILIIAAGPGAWLNKHILSHRIFIFIGLISYPLYLWHWPLLSFARIVSGHTLAWEYRALIVLFSIFLAWVTFTTVEKPWRQSRPSLKKVALLLALMVGIGAAGQTVYAMNGLTFRPIAQDGAALNSLWNPRGSQSCKDPALAPKTTADSCIFMGKAENVNAAIIGDSHAQDKISGLLSTDTKRSWMLLSNSLCPPVYGVEVTGFRRDCAAKTARIITWLAQNPTIHTVALAFISGYTMTTPYAADHVSSPMSPERTAITHAALPGAPRADIFAKGLDESVSRLLKAGKRVIVLIDVPELPFFPRDCIRRGENCTAPLQDIQNRQRDVRQMLTRLQRLYPRLQVYDPLPLFCGPQSCAFRQGKTIFYQDSNHLTADGSKAYAARLVRWLDYTSN